VSGLRDLAGTAEKVTVRGQAIEVPGLSIDGIAQLLNRFDEVRGWLSGGAVDLSAEALVGTGPHLVAAVIAAGTGAPGDEQAEAVASDLAVGEQLALLEAIMRVSFPDGLGNFLNRLTAAADAVGLDLEVGAEPAPATAG
jgi:hypothetical protein